MRPSELTCAGVMRVSRFMVSITAGDTVFPQHVPAAAPSGASWANPMVCAEWDAEVPDLAFHKPPQCTTQLPSRGGPNLSFWFACLLVFCKVNLFCAWCLAPEFTCAALRHPEISYANITKGAGLV